MENSNSTFFDRFCELKNDCLDFIERHVLRNRQSNFLNIDNGIKTPNGTIYRIEVDSAGAYVDVRKDGETETHPKKLIELGDATIIKIACFLDGSII